MQSKEKYEPYTTKPGPSEIIIKLDEYFISIVAYVVLIQLQRMQIYDVVRHD